ncbi:LysR family transcriptional regulator [Aeromonas intestinalis]
MDNHKLDTLYLMRLLLAIARFGSFAAAANHLGITPSKASKDLRHLEQNLGAVLLSRTTRRVQLTDAGKLACQQADQMIALHEELLDGLQRRRHSLITRSQDYARHDTWPLLHQGRDIPLEVTGELAFSSKKSIQMAMCQGFGIARLPRYLVAEDLAAGTVCEVLPAYRPKGAHFYALYTQRRADSALITHFLDYVIRELGGPSASPEQSAS